jgi:hypothetical protein
MYSTCIFCHSSLGKNEAVEHFPVGRRLAFDGAKGRLWVVCSKCGRWNLTPLEERWEAVEECERQYRGTITRASTDEIGLARVGEGTDLIRIGKPLRPELASWRYGRHFRERRRKSQIAIGLGAASYAALGLAYLTGGIVAGPVMMVGPSAFTLLISVASRHTELERARKFITRRAEEGFGRKVRKHEQVGLRMIPTDDEQGWALRFALDGRFLDFHGHDAVHTAHLIAPAINATGGSPSDVHVAVRDIEIAGSPDRYFKRVLKFGQEKHWHYTGLDEYPDHMRLAFEMVAHEETERAAMEGELKQLEDDWRQAEEIAAIADNLFLPKAVTDFIDRHRPGAKT